MTKPGQLIPERKLAHQCSEKILKTRAVNFVRLKQTAKLNTIKTERNEKTAEVIQNAEKNFALDLPSYQYSWKKRRGCTGNSI